MIFQKKEDRKEVITNGHSSPDSRSRESKSGDVKHRDKSTDEKKPSEKEKESTRERSSKRSRSHHKDKNNENDTTDRTVSTRRLGRNFPNRTSYRIL